MAPSFRNGCETWLGIHTPERGNGNSHVILESFVVMDSGLADFVRAPE
jgi:hypothetical protein